MTKAEKIYLRNLIDIIKSSIDETRIVVLKGIPFNVLLKVNGSEFIFNKPLSDSNILLDNIINNENELLACLYGGASEGFLLWEQFALIKDSINDKLKAKICVIYDNLRSLYPYRGDIMLAEPTFRLDDQDLPKGYSDLLIVGDNNYIKYVSNPTEVKCIPLFDKKSPITDCNETINRENIIDFDQDAISIELSLNSIIENNSMNNLYIVKSRKDFSLNVGESDLEYINGFLKQISLTVEFIQDFETLINHAVDDDTEQLLKKYWGASAEFRNLNIYSNPDIDNQVISLSQGEIVQTIIEECKNSKREDTFQDIFLTAPTGSGKSLLFQLPAFFLSELNEVTIVVSPLISLMKDQVKAIKDNRGFSKVEYLNSELSFIERDRIIRECRDGFVDILYMSPELLLSYNISYFTGERRIGLIVIDEAHLVTTWGRDFRVDYWFLGAHIQKIRKYSESRFPIIAVTATAVYGGANDMVFECIESLYLSNPHLYIGKVARENIVFEVGNEEIKGQGFDKKKIEQTRRFIRDVYEKGLKTLIYTPYTRHINVIYDSLEEPIKGSTSKYFGSLDKNHKTLAYENFLSGNCKIMLATKAFGMGVDISDIEVVYHHAPSGQLADYIQEVGRIAREESLTGYAIINFSERDTHYTKVLHGLSAIKTFQLQEVMRKVYKSYMVNKSHRNLLLSTDDFQYIFPEEDQEGLSQKVMTSLMMIEKDLLYKNRFNVILARPKKLFATVFSRVSKEDYDSLIRLYPSSITIMEKTNEEIIISIDLDKIWRSKFQDLSFSVLKAKYYNEGLFENYNVKVKPVLKIKCELDRNSNSILYELNIIVNNIIVVLSKLKSAGKFFEEKDLRIMLAGQINNESAASNLTTYLLSLFSSYQSTINRLYDKQAFIQKRRNNNSFQYRVISSKFQRHFSGLQGAFKQLFPNEDKNRTTKYIEYTDQSSMGFIGLGYLLEILNLGTYEVSGGKAPMVFIRINDPDKIKGILYSDSFQNSILDDVYKRHQISNKIFNYFFLNKFTNSDRWSFIEDYFLGTDIDVLFENYSDKIIKDEADEAFTPLKSISTDNIKEPIKEGFEFTRFEPKKGKTYAGDDIISLEIQGENQTDTIYHLIKNKPVELHKQILKIGFKLNKRVYNILLSKLEANHKEYFKEVSGYFRRATIFINRQPQTKGVEEWIKQHPVKFYLWWLKNQKSVRLHTNERLQLISNVYTHNKEKLRKEHLKYFK